MSRLAAARRRADRLFVLALTVLALLATARLLVVRPAEPPPGGSARQQVGSFDEAQIRRLILEGRLSDHEALYYRKLPYPPTP